MSAQVRAYELLWEFGVKIKYSRINYGSFDKEVVTVVEAYCKFFFIRAQRWANLYDKIKEVTVWEDAEIGFKGSPVACQRKFNILLLLIIKRLADFRK